MGQQSPQGESLSPAGSPRERLESWKEIAAYPEAGRSQRIRSPILIEPGQRTAAPTSNGISDTLSSYPTN